MGNGERVEEGWGLLGNPSHPWSGVYGAVLGQTGTDISPVKSEIPHVRERSVKVRPPHYTLGGKLLLEVCGKRWGEAVQECGVRGGGDLPCNGP